MFGLNNYGNILCLQEKGECVIDLSSESLLNLRTPTEERVLAFQKILLDHHITAYIRRPRGDDVSAARRTRAPIRGRRTAATAGGTSTTT
jgi:hypothetical protein